MNQKILVSKPGYNVITETNPNNLIFSSDYDTLKYYSSGNVTLDLNGGTTVEGTITHNLGYAPFFAVYASLGSPQTNWSNVPVILDDYPIAWIFFSAWVDATKLYIRSTADSVKSMTLISYYKIFRNDLGI